MVQHEGVAQPSQEISDDVDRSPVDLVISHDDRWVVTVNQMSNSLSLIELPSGKLCDEIVVGARPQSIAISPDGEHVLVSCSDAGQVVLVKVADGSLKPVGGITTGYQPHGIAMTGDGRLAYVALSAAGKVAVIDLAASKVIDQIEVGRWPRYIALSADGLRFAVGTSGDRGITVVDTATKKIVSQDKFMGLNIGHLELSRDGDHVWFPWVVYRQNPISPANIRLGWVLATRLGRVDLQGASRREAMSLDPQGKAIGDPHGIAETSDGKRLVVSASGTHEILVYRVEDLPMRRHGSSDHVPAELLADEDRFARISLGGRPMGLRITSDDRRAFVANYLHNSIQEIDLKDRKLVREIFLGGPATPSLARQGEAIFFDAQRSLDQWYSCHTCHYEGGSNATAMDTFNDDSWFTFKTVLPLQGAAETAPWLWHGNRDDLSLAVRKSITSTMLGPEPTDHDVAAVVAYLKTLKPPTSPWQPASEEEIAAWNRGKSLFGSDRLGCSSCHSGEQFTDGLNHDVGLHGERDLHREFNTPSLRGLYARVVFLHDGRSTSLEELLRGPHQPQATGGTETLTDDELLDLIVYLKSL